ncbi:MAG: S41 family peptidase [Burkholderiales bacterium]
MKLSSGGTKVARMARVGTAIAGLLALASCGGGGDGGTPVFNGSGGLVASSSVAQRCVAPRSGTSDVLGTLADEKSWVRSWIDETYLWYQDVQALNTTTLNASNYATPEDYFDVLKSPLLTTSGKEKDHFHFIYDTPTWIALSQSGVSYGYGFEVALTQAPAPQYTPRKAQVAYTNAGTPAATAGIARGAQILTVDGVDLVNGSDVVTLNAGLFPTVAGTHTFGVLDLGATTPRNVTLTAAALAPSTVQNVKTLPAPNQTVGYMQFNDHLATSEAQLVTAINQLKTSGITELMLDLRYNGGGYLDVASELAFMIAGPTPTSGMTFEREQFNDKNPFGLTAAQTITPFHSTAQGFSLSSGTALPSLNLSRVFVLVGAGTCSASEAIVNGLRGVGVQVNLIGATTCGKPYGFFPQDNCGTTYFSIQFQGVNQLGQGDYADGFVPTCAASDDFTHQLGDPAEGRLAAALTYRATGVCAPVAKAQGVGGVAALPEPTLMRNPLRENRIFRR